MLRLYDLTKYRNQNCVLYCEVRRFFRDVPFVLRYYFDSGKYEFNAPSSWLAIGISDEVRRFVELVNSPYWLAEIKPNMIECDEYDDRCLF